MCKLEFMLVILTCILSILSSVSGFLHNTCPISSHYDVTTNGFLNYPNMYFPNAQFGKYRCYTGEPLSDSDIYKEERPSGRAPLTDTRCATNDKCPITHRNVQMALYATKWETYIPGLLKIAESIKNNKEVYSFNVIISGGSMTEGRMTGGGCMCCVHREALCSLKTTECFVDEKACSWASIFVDWLQAEFSWINITVIDISTSGLASDMAPRNLNSYFYEHNIQLTAYDIFFLDHSVNEARQGSINEVQTGVEGYIRHIIQLYAALKPPTLILIEQYGYRDLSGNSAEPTNTQSYTYVFRKLAEHYKLLLWSIKDVYWSYDMNMMYPIDPRNTMHRMTHPPWYVHLFMADLLAATILHVVKTNTKDIVSSNSIKFMSLDSGYSLPTTSLFHLVSNAWCRLDLPYVLSAHPKSTFTPTNLTDYENVATGVGETGWREYIDYHGVAGWIINDRATAVNLTFPLLMTNRIKKRLQKKVKEGMERANIELMVEYLESYEVVRNCHLVIITI